MKKTDDNCLTFPMEYLNVTQSYSGSFSHLPHNTGSPADYPIDCAGRDTGRDYFICPCDEMEVIRIYGVGSKGTNTVFLRSKKKVLFADGTKDYASMLVIHPDDDDLKKLKAGQKFSRGEKMFREGKDGAAANHLHISVGRGKIKGSGWQQNSKGKWVLTTAKGAVKPEEAFFTTGDTKIIKTAGLAFPLLLDKPVRYETRSALNIRAFAGTGFAKKGLYPKGMIVSVKAKLGNWGLTDRGWICLNYCRKAVI